MEHLVKYFSPDSVSSYPFKVFSSAVFSSLRVKNKNGTEERRA
jgi:hypothetical protein